MDIHSTCCYLRAQDVPEQGLKMSATAKKQAQTPQDIRARKGGVPIVSLTAYTTPMARMMDAHCDFVLVGDSVGMVLHGLPSTLGVTMELMIMHGQAVATRLEQSDDGYRHAIRQLRTKP